MRRIIELTPDQRKIMFEDASERLGIPHATRTFRIRGRMFPVGFIVHAYVGGPIFP